MGKPITLQERILRVKSEVDRVGHNLYSRDNWDTEEAKRQMERLTNLKRYLRELVASLPADATVHGT